MADRTATGPTIDPPGPQRVLVVEDDPDIRDMVAVILRRPGRQVVATGSAEEALGELERERFEVVVCDLRLGAGMSGWDVAEQVRLRWPGTSFVLLTAAADRRTGGLELRPGVDAVLSKPCYPRELTATVDTHVARSARTS
jgi:DNA-binding response OmpR family regulator